MYELNSHYLNFYKDYRVGVDKEYHLHVLKECEDVKTICDGEIVLKTGEMTLEELEKEDYSDLERDVSVGKTLTFLKNRIGKPMMCSKCLDILIKKKKLREDIIRIDRENERKVLGYNIGGRI